MNNEETVYALNEWMRRYIETPAEYEAEFKSVIGFLDDEKEGREPNYGVNCAAYMEKLLAERNS